jgi:hypothetical protein
MQCMYDAQGSLECSSSPSGPSGPSRTWGEPTIDGFKGGKGSGLVSKSSSAPPSGSYLTTGGCTQCRMKGLVSKTTLQCSCPARNGGVRKISTLANAKRCTSDIANCGGKLVCGACTPNY